MKLSGRDELQIVKQAVEAAITIAGRETAYRSSTPGGHGFPNERACARSATATPREGE